ncbi:hypothetical protein K491DRAFT_716618 [Lophiostoma macrostomum CBS 122681]|uniref:Uncharacterized protein n=1 Tax=Lophiostoma macrostomum CBS 122681 TaxID=1314788 RepID=A0A6A6T4N0_9PLEO|nr:hypothetical protein K491DRAFT_716618 [Lophiostoma macrostomum CBS 122681]
MSIPQALLDQVRAGSRCVICGGVNGSPADQDDRRCAACEAITNEDVEFLMEAAEKLREILVEFLRRGRRRIPTDDRLSDSEKKRLEACLLFQERCRQAAVWMPATLEQILLKAENTNVEKIEEMEIKTHSMRNETWDHVVHAIHLKTGDKYVLELTGVQFGPDWPLLQSHEEYCKRAAEIKSLNKLGTNQQLRLDLWDDDEEELEAARFWVKKIALEDKLESVPWEVETSSSSPPPPPSNPREFKEAVVRATSWYQDNFDWENLRKFTPPQTDQR